ncbi:hypothetical protein Lfu02_73120 [Longispora fulva]|nr:hypothetical protein Lfu02_73120 [Longispora fulva]
MVAQWVRTWWTKQSRGEPGASQRNATPDGFMLPGGSGPLVHEVSLHERDGFRRQFQTRHEPPDKHDVRVQWRHGLLEVQLVASIWGMPRRAWRPPPVGLTSG